jgi:hypothetical protein
MKILVIDQCSKEKDYPDAIEPYDAEAIGESTREALLERDSTARKKARTLYAGRQQSYVTEAVDKLRRSGDTVDRYFISAGFGLVAEDDFLPPYNVTFADHTPVEIERRASKLDIQSDIVDLLSGDYDLVFFALGGDYYRSMNLSAILEETPSDTWVVCFNCQSDIEGFENAISIPARTEQAKNHGTIVVALKGKYIQNFAEHRSHGRQVSGTEDIEVYCTTSYTTQSGLDQYDE